MRKTGCATSTSLTRPHMSRRLELGLDAVWMTVTSLVHCHALHVAQHVAVSLSEPLNQMISSAPFIETVFAYLDPEHTGFNFGITFT